MAETALEKKIKQIIDETSSKYLGITIDRLSEELTMKAAKGLLDFNIDSTKSYREAKREFRRALLTRLLLLRLGNISEVARDLEVDRRTIHRMVIELGIDVAGMKKNMARPYDVRLGDMNSRLENVLDRYKEIIHPNKLKTLYMNVSELSDSIIRELPLEMKSLKQAENDFEQAYLRQVLEKHNGAISEAAKSIEIRYETLARKAKKLGIKRTSQR